MNSWEVVGWVSTHHKLIPTQVVLRKTGSSATSALYGRAGPVTFSYDITRYANESPLGLAPDIAPKVTKNASPCTPLLPAVLATGGTRTIGFGRFA